MQAPAARHRPAIRRLAIGLTSVLALLLLWGAFGRWGVPLLVERALERQGAEQLGRRVGATRIEFNPWTLELTLVGLKVDAADAAAPAPGGSGAPPLLEVERLHADVAWQSLLRLAPVIDALTIDAPHLRVARIGDGRYDFDDVVARLAARPSIDAPSEPARFAVHNIVVARGRLDFADRPLGKTHAIADLQLALPFVSSLPTEREVRVEPRVAFTLDGSRFDSAAAATPFAANRKGEATLSIAALDVRPFLGYVPNSMPLRLESARLGADLRFAFESVPKAALKVSGSVEVTDIALTDLRSAEWLKAGKLRVVIDELRPLEQTARLARLEVDAPHLFAARDANRRINLLLGAASESGGEGAASPPPVGRIPLPTTPASAAARASEARAAGSSKGGWKVALDQLALRAGVLEWRDAAVAPRATLALADFALDAEAIAWPIGAPVVFSGGGRIEALGGGVAASTAASAPLNERSAGGRSASASKGVRARTTRSPADSATESADRASIAAAPSAATLRFSGRANDREAALDATLAAWPLEHVAPYVASFVEPALKGRLDADLAIRWRQDGTQGADRSNLLVDVKRAVLANLSLGDAGQAAVAASRIEVAGGSVDVDARRASLARLALVEPRAQVERGSDGRWMFERWLKAAPQAASRAEPQTGGVAAAAPEQARWAVRLDEATVERGAVRYVDRAAGTPVAVDVDELKLQVAGFALAASAPTRVALSARVAEGRAAAPKRDPQENRARGGAAETPPATGDARPASSLYGRVEFRGDIGPLAAPAQAGSDSTALRGNVVLRDFPLHALEPYFAGALNVDVERAQTSFKGTIDAALGAAGPRLRLAGDAAIDEFRARSVLGAEAAPRAGLVLRREGNAGPTLLTWKSLSLRGVEVGVAPRAALGVAIGESAITDFFARIAIDENGRINLQDVVSNGAGAPTSAAARPAQASSASAAATASPPQPVAVASASADRPPPVLRFGPTTFVNGRVNFSDRFIKPNYTANLSELTGRLGAFSSDASNGVQPAELADLELRGRAEGTASLEITGRLNPLAKPLALDVRAKVRDLELPPLSPYAIKYAGYGIERGKMSVDVQYLVQPDGRLTATNDVVLNQLAFGDKVEGSTASLPVKLAVALLADRHGVIQLDLPVSGSINDPQFSVGSVIWKVVTNLVVKAVTAPFASLASAFGGGGSELASVEFPLGTAALTGDAKQSLDKVAQALNDRPQLKMTVTGQARLDAERDAWKRERLLQLARSEKRRTLIAAGGDPNAEVTVSDAEYPALLKEVYRRAEISKPRNLVGLVKDLPTGEMEALLLASISVTAEQMQQLAVRRGVAVRDYLAAKSLPSERLFLGAAKTEGGGAEWKPHADLKLTLE